MLQEMPTCLLHYQMPKTMLRIAPPCPYLLKRNLIGGGILDTPKGNRVELLHVPHPARPSSSSAETLSLWIKYSAP